MNHILKIPAIAILAISSILCLSSCEKSLNLPVVSTTSVSAITQTSAITGGNVTSDGGATVTERGVLYSTSSDPINTGTKVTVGSGTGTFSTKLTGLTNGTTCYFVAYATNSAGTAYGDELSFTTDKPDITGQTGTLRDYDGNAYNWIGIGKQAWMAENLKVTHYADGTAIPLVEGKTAWDALGITDKAYCWYNHSTSNGEIYGGMYTWATAMNGAASSTSNPSGVQGVCPAGWHVPSSMEWTYMTDYLGGKGVAGGKLKETGTIHWADPNTGATNETGFTALPGGYRNSNGHLFNLIGSYGYWWSTSAYDADNIYRRYMGYDYANVYSYFNSKNYGFSVRCVRD